MRERVKGREREVDRQMRERATCGWREMEKERVRFEGERGRGRVSENTPNPSHRRLPEGNSHL